MFKILLCLAVLGTALADNDFDDRFDDSREIHFVGGSPTLKTVGVPLPFNFFKNIPATKTNTNVEPTFKAASDVEVVHVDQKVEPSYGTTAHKNVVPPVKYQAPFIVKIDDDDDDDNKVFFRTAGAPSVPLTYSSVGPYRFKYDFDDDDDDDDHKGFFRSANFRNNFRFNDNDRKVFFRSVGVPLPVVKSASNVAPNYYVAKYEIDDDDDARRFFFRTAGKPSPIPYAARYKFDDDDLFDFDDK